MELRGFHRPGPANWSQASSRTALFMACAKGGCDMPPTQYTGSVHVAGSCRSAPIAAHSKSTHSSITGRGTAPGSLTKPSPMNISTRALVTGASSYMAAGALHRIKAGTSDGFAPAKRSPADPSCERVFFAGPRLIATTGS